MKLNTEQEVRDLFALLGVTEVKRPEFGDGWEVYTSVTCGKVGKFLHEKGLLDWASGYSGCGTPCRFTYNNRPDRYPGIPASWLPKSAKPGYRPSIVACKKAIADAGFSASYLRIGIEDGVKVTDEAIPFNLAFVDCGKGLQARFLSTSQAFNRDYKQFPVTVEQAVTLVKRAAALLVSL